MNVFHKYQKSVLAVEHVAREKISDYGIIKGTKIDESLYLIEDMIEKPSPDKAPSNIAAVGRYVLTPRIFNCIKETPPGKGNEIQITDAIRMLMKGEDVYAYAFKGKRYDAGDKLGYLKAIVDFALERDDLGSGVSRDLRTLR
jgi:UTP--glucose-1-phosphate uridylyltransferase